MVKIRCWRLILLYISALCSHNSSAAICEFVISNEWNSGFTSAVTMTNNTDQTIDGWTTSLDFVDETYIANIWNASLSTSNPYQISNESYNRVILPGGTTSFGFNAQKSTSNTPAQIPILGGICNSNANNRPTAQVVVSALQGTIPFTVDFDASSSTDSEGDDLSYLWQFDEGDTSTGITTTRTFSEPGTYTVSLTVNDGSLDSTITSVTINAVSVEPATANCEYILDNEWSSGFTSSIHITNVADQAFNGWAVSIEFPDNSASISHIWNADLSGNNPYQASNKEFNSTVEPDSTVTFGFNSNKSASGTSVQPPVLGGICGNENTNQPPDINATVSPMEGTVPFTVNFDASNSSDPDGDDLAYFWAFDDGTSAQNVVATKDYTEAGSYTVSLTLTDSHQAISTEMFTIIAKEPVVDKSYILDEQSSSLFFVSTKNVHIIESQTFTGLGGDISPQGEVVVRVNLDSIDSGIAIRDERMRNFLFETAVFSEAQISLNVDMNEITGITVGSSIEQTINPEVNLHGVSALINAQVRITRLHLNTLLVQNISPILFKVEDFDMTGGIEALRNLAGLSVISHSVPVNFILIFNTP